MPKCNHAAARRKPRPLSWPVIDAKLLEPVAAWDRGARVKSSAAHADSSAVACGLEAAMREQVPEADDHDDVEDAATCARCHGFGTDPGCDHILPCPDCVGDAL